MYFLLDKSIKMDDENYDNISSNKDESDGEVSVSDVIEHSGNEQSYNELYDVNICNMINVKKVFNEENNRSLQCQRYRITTKLSSRFLR